MPSISIPDFSDPGTATGMAFLENERQLDASGFLSDITSSVISFRKSRQKIVLIIKDARSSGCNGETVISGDMPGAQPLITHHYVRELPSNKPFKKRQRLGEIVLSSADHASVDVISEPGLSGEGNPLTGDAGASINGDWLVAHLGWTKTWWSRPSRWAYHPPGRPDVFMINIFMKNLPYKYYSKARLTPAINLTAEGVYHLVRQHNTVDTSVVTSTVAEANKRMLDLLTLMAETPETLKSAYTFLSQACIIIRDLKRGKFNLTKAYQDKNKLIKRKYLEDLVKIDNMKKLYAEEAKTQRLSRRIENRRANQIRRLHERALIEHKRASKKSLLEFNSAMADVWMNFRYNIMPTTYALMEITDVITKNPEFLTTRDGIRQTVEVDIGLVRPLTYNNLFSVFVKDVAKSDMGPFTLSSKTMSANAVVTAWELVPLSFVVDWFINIGDFLSAITGGSTADRGSTISWKTEIDWEHTDNLGRRVRVTGKLYNRKTAGNLQQYTCLVLNPDLSPYRITDSIALLWNAIRGDLQRSIK